jgi:uncharacterized FAD-dependent dehydrogenase
MHYYQINQVKIPLAEKENIEVFFCDQYKVSLKNFKVLRLSLDSRKKRKMLWVANLYFESDQKLKIPGIILCKPYAKSSAYVNADGLGLNFKQVIHIVGAGPCGLWAALSLVKKGYKVHIYERGNPVEERFRDIRKFLKQNNLNENSNVLYGEGGAGAFSDGKLTCRTRNDFTKQVLQDFVDVGAPDWVEFASRAHIGTDQLQFHVKGIRKWIQELGGVFHFNSCLDDLDVQNNSLKRFAINGQWIESENLIVATGHSARDVYKLLYHNGVKMECKDFAIGFRVEHPQALINNNRYGSEKVLQHTGTAEYSLFCKIDGGAYSFCMCPGGVLIPCSTQQGMMATNGMSYSTRKGKFANSGIVVPITFKNNDVFEGLNLQEKLESDAFQIGGKNFGAPAQMASSFLAGKEDKSLPRSTFPTGLTPFDHTGFFPSDVEDRLKKSIEDFDRKIPGFIEQGVLVSPETRTSSPIRIYRDDDTLESSIRGIYPLGEGGGYAGGIVSSAADGVRFAAKVVDRD